VLDFQLIEKAIFIASGGLFKEHGLPASIRADNGVPVASPNSLFVTCTSVQLAYGCV
jgi:hypothetical protein